MGTWHGPLLTYPGKGAATRENKFYRVSVLLPLATDGEPTFVMTIPRGGEAGAEEALRFNFGVDHVIISTQ